MRRGRCGNGSMTHLARRNSPRPTALDCALQRSGRARCRRHGRERNAATRGEQGRARRGPRSLRSLASVAGFVCHGEPEARASCSNKAPVVCAVACAYPIQRFLASTANRRRPSAAARLPGRNLTTSRFVVRDARRSPSGQSVGKEREEVLEVVSARRSPNSEGYRPPSARGSRGGAPEASPDSRPGSPANGSPVR